MADEYDESQDGASEARDDDVITPDDVTEARGRRDRFGLDDLDELARSAVDSVLHLVRRANALAGGVLIFAIVAAGGGFPLGLAALSDGMRTVWILLGGFFLVVAVGSVIVAMLRLRSVRRSADDLVGEVRELLASGGATRQTVAETVEITSGNDDDGLADLSRQFVTIRGEIGDRVGQFRQLTSALSAITTFPGLLALATLVSFVFLGLGAIFAISLVL